MIKSLTLEAIKQISPDDLHEVDNIETDFAIDELLRECVYEDIINKFVTWAAIDYDDGQYVLWLYGSKPTIEINKIHSRHPNCVIWDDVSHRDNRLRYRRLIGGLTLDYALKLFDITEADKIYLTLKHSCIAPAVPVTK